MASRQTAPKIQVRGGENRRRENRRIENGAEENLAGERNYRPAIKDVNIDLSLPRDLWVLQDSAALVLQDHSQDGLVAQEIRDLIYFCLRGKPLTDNQLFNWTGSVCNFVEKLHVVMDQSINVSLTEAVLKELRLVMSGVMRGCVECYFELTSFAERREFVLAFLKGDFIEKLQQAYFNEEFIEKILAIPANIKKMNGLVLSGEEQQAVKRFLEETIAEVSIDVWFEHDELIMLCDQDINSVIPLTMKMTIEVAGKLPNASQESRTPEEEWEEAKRIEAMVERQVADLIKRYDMESVQQSEGTAALISMACDGGTASVSASQTEGESGERRASSTRESSTRIAARKEQIIHVGELGVTVEKLADELDETVTKGDLSDDQNIAIMRKKLEDLKKAVNDLTCLVNDLKDDYFVVGASSTRIAASKERIMNAGDLVVTVGKLADALDEIVSKAKRDLSDYQDVAYMRRTFEDLKKAGKDLTRLAKDMKDLN